MNAFGVLGIDERLVISEDEIRSAFREAGKKVHPDAGGGEGEFSKLKEALAILSSPSKRLRHWLSLRGVEIEIRGTIGNELMDLFSEVGTATQRAETIIRQREEAKSALSKALLESQTQISREEVENAIAKVDAIIEAISKEFSAMETVRDANPEDAARMVRDLAFLEKWRTGLRSCYSRLI